MGEANAFPSPLSPLSPHNQLFTFCTSLAAPLATLFSRFIVSNTPTWSQALPHPPLSHRSPLTPVSTKPHTPCPTAVDTAVATAADAMADAATPTGTNTATLVMGLTTTTTTRANTHRMGRAIPLLARMGISVVVFGSSFHLLFLFSQYSTRRSSSATALASLAAVGQAGGHALAAIA